MLSEKNISKTIIVILGVLFVMATATLFVALDNNGKISESSQRFENIMVCRDRDTGRFAKCE